MGRTARVFVGCVVVASASLQPACGGGSGAGSAFETTHPVGLAWEQPDGLAEYYLVRSGPTFIRRDEPTVTLQLTPGPHDIELQACNEAGCSAATTVTVDWRQGHWVLVDQRLP